MMKRVFKGAAAAALVPDGATVLVGGFMGVGSPHRLIDAFLARGTRNLTVVCNDLCTPTAAELIVGGEIQEMDLGPWSASPQN